MRLAELAQALAAPPEIGALLTAAIADEPAVLLRDGGVIASGFDAELDELRAISQNCDAFLLDLEARERGRTGIARMVLESKAPVIPVAMIDTEKVQPIGKRLPRIRRIGIVVGTPLDFSRFDGMEGDRIVLRAVTDEIMYELRKLSGQEYVDAHASSVKEKRARLAR